MTRIPCDYTSEYLLMLFVPILLVLWFLTFLIADEDSQKTIRTWIIIAGSGLLLASTFAPEIFCKNVQIDSSA